MSDEAQDLKLSEHALDPCNQNMALQFDGGDSYELFMESGSGPFEVAPPIVIQSGDFGTVGNIGWTIEALLLVAKHRIETLNVGAFRCADNEVAIEKIQQALEALADRARDRKARGVEGTDKP